MKIKKAINNVFTILLYLIFFSLLLTVIVSKASGGEPNVFGYQLKTVLSGSMEPTFLTGSIIAIKPGGDMTRFKEGDVITFRDSEEKLITHRIKDVHSSGNTLTYETIGDNNNAPDPDFVLPQNVVGEYMDFTIPYIGYFLTFTKSKLGALLLLVLPGVLMLSYSVFSIWKAISQLDIKQVKTTDSN